ncbi:CHAP domain protein [compost metagenome]
MAWKLAKDGKEESRFSYLGHAKAWWDRFSGIDASQVRKGDVIVSPANGYGHVMYVEYVSGGHVYFTDYNGAGGAVSPGQGSLPLSTATNNYSYKVVRF